MIERVSGTTEDQPVVAVQFGSPSPDVGIGLEFTDRGVEALLADYIEQIGAQLLFLLNETGRVVTDDQFDPKNPAHDIEFTDSVFGEMVLEAISIQVPVSQQSMFTHMERGAINRLIRLLRKARDTTFGRDE